MFEYLMPLLVMPTYENTLLDQTYQAAVRRQIQLRPARGGAVGHLGVGVQHRPMLHMNYQYRAFGVPGLGFKRGLAEDLVVAPYASALALMVAPEAACRNLERLVAEGRLGAYGLYEAIDYTPARVPVGQRLAPSVRQFMAHHEGMSLLALAYVLLDRADAAPLRSRPDHSCRRPVASGTDAPGRARSFRIRRSLSSAQTAAEHEVPMRVFTDAGRPKLPKSICFPTADTTW